MIFRSTTAIFRSSDRCSRVFTPLLPFLGRRPRLYWLFGGVYLGIVAWFWIHQLDRYLQVLVPWMAAATAVVLVLLWRQGRSAATRGRLSGWATDRVGRRCVLHVHPSRRRLIESPRSWSTFSVDAMQSKAAIGSFPIRTGSPWGRRCPSGAKVLVHEEEIHLGLSAVSMSDYPGNQGIFYWGEPGVSYTGWGVEDFACSRHHPSCLGEQDRSRGRHGRRGTRVLRSRHAPYEARW